MAPKYRILPGLPPYGPMPAQFSADGKGSHQEGFVVEFTPEHGPVWVGNFQRGGGRLETVLLSRDGATMTVIARGRAYVVGLHSQRMLAAFGDRIRQVIELPECFIFSDDLRLEARDGGRLLWQSRDLSCDGLDDFQIDGNFLVGNAFDPGDDVWIPFKVDIATGEATGGACPPDLEVFFNKEAQVAKP